MPAQPIICPVCGKNDAIQKVSGVVASGTASGTFSGPSGGVVNIDGEWGATGGYATLSGATASNLAYLLTPPQEPKKRAFGWLVTVVIWYFCGAFALAGAVYSVIFLAQGKPGDMLGLSLLMAVGIAGLWWYFRKHNERKAEYPTEKLAWDKAMARWGTSYFYSRDDVVFDPATGETCRPQEMKQFLDA